MRYFCAIWRGGSKINEHCAEKWRGRHFEIFGGLVVPFSRKVGHDTVKECFRCVCMDPNRDTGALAEVW